MHTHTHTHTHTLVAAPRGVAAQLNVLCLCHEEAKSSRALETTLCTHNSTVQIMNDSPYKPTWDPVSSRDVNPVRLLLKLLLNDPTNRERLNNRPIFPISIQLYMAVIYTVYIFCNISRWTLIGMKQCIVYLIIHTSVFRKSMLKWIKYDHQAFEEHLL